MQSTHELPAIAFTGTLIMDDKQSSESMASTNRAPHWFGYTLCVLLSIVNVFVVGGVQASLWAKTVADSSFAGMYVVMAVFLYTLPALAASAAAAASYSNYCRGSALGVWAWGALAASVTVGIWIHALAHLVAK